MAERSAIEWCDSTFNPWLGCTKISPACDHCYAEAHMDTRLGRVQWGAGQPRQRTSAANWRQPLKWNAQADYFGQCDVCGHRGEKQFMQAADGRKVRTAVCQSCNNGLMQPARRRVFCASLADWLDKEVPVAWLADLLSLIHRTPNLDWLLLSKRIGNWRARISAVVDLFEHRMVVSGLGDNHGYAMTRNWLTGEAPANVWLGATVCNQPEADRDIPKLLAVPARVRFLSIEPMLSAINLDYWIRPTVHCGACGFYYPPAEAIPDPNGHLMGADECSKCGAHSCMGTWWGEEAIEERSRSDDEELDDWDCGYKLHQIICGGESGPHARPMHPDWVRSLRDQCAAAGVPFLLKQWGEWIPPDQQHGGPLFMSRADQITHERSGRFCVVGGMPFWKIGKRAAGRLLDGKEHNGFPVVTP